MVNEYSRRELSHDNDILNAFQGILDRALQSSTNPVGNIFGIPFDRIRLPHRSVAEGLLSGISWGLETAGERRNAFPSWSWARWKGTASSYMGATCGNNLLDIGVSFESLDGLAKTEWSEASESSGETSNQDHLRTLVLDCRTIPLSRGAFLNKSSSRAEVSKVGHAHNGATIVRIGDSATSTFFPLDRSLALGTHTLGDQLRGIPLKPLINDSYRLVLSILVVQRKTDFWERVGHIECTDVLPAYFAKTRREEFLDRVSSPGEVVRIM